MEHGWVAARDTFVLLVLPLQFPRTHITRLHYGNPVIYHDNPWDLPVCQSMANYGKLHGLPSAMTPPRPALP